MTNQLPTFRLTRAQRKEIKTYIKDELGKEHVPGDRVISGWCVGATDLEAVKDCAIAWCLDNRMEG